MRHKDFPLALAILAGAFLLVGGCWYQGDLETVWVYDVQPWLRWDGEPSSEPVGEGLQVLGQRRASVDAE